VASLHPMGLQAWFHAYGCGARFPESWLDQPERSSRIIPKQSGARHSPRSAEVPHVRIRAEEKRIISSDPAGAGSSGDDHTG